jgi:hypothetical protein
MPTGGAHSHHRPVDRQVAFGSAIEARATGAIRNQNWPRNGLRDPEPKEVLIQRLGISEAKLGGEEMSWGE